LIIKNDKDFFELKSISKSGLVNPIPIILSFEIAKNDCSIQTLEGIQSVKKDDFVMTGLEGEKYCITKENFHKKYTILELDKNNINLARKNISEDTKYEFIKPTIETFVLMNNELFKISNNDYIARYEENDFGIIKNNLFPKLYKII
jgi:hypothetical protein